MKLAVITFILIFLGYNVYQIQKFTRAELKFRDAVRYVGGCGAMLDMRVCVEAGKKLQGVINLNPKECYYRFNMYGVLNTLYTAFKDVKLLHTAYAHLNATEENCWDSHYTNIHKANIHMRLGHYEEARKEMAKAKIYLPHNAEVKKIQAFLGTK